MDTALQHGRDYILYARPCIPSPVNDTFCIIVKDTAGINWGAACWYRLHDCGAGRSASPADPDIQVAGATLRQSGMENLSLKQSLYSVRYFHFMFQ